MATLLITKKTGDYFSFVLNGDYSNEILNTRNDLTVVKSNEAHFKTANGANLIKEQIIYPSDVTIVDGATTLNPTTTIQLFTMLRSVGYFDWIDSNGGGGGGVNKFVDLLDTFSFFGKDGQVPVVDESQSKLVATPFYNVQNFTDLDDVPGAYVDGKWLRSSGSGLFFDDLPPAPTDPNALPSGGYVGTGADLNNEIDAISTDLDANYYTKPEVDSKISTVYKYKGSITTYANLPTTERVVGDVWNALDTDINWAWTGTVWDNLGGMFDVSGKEDKSNKQNSLTPDGTGQKYVTVDATIVGLGTKLDKGTYTGAFTGVIDVTKQRTVFYSDYKSGSIVNLSLSSEKIFGAVATVRIKGNLLGTIPVGWNLSGQPIINVASKMNELTIMYVSDSDIRLVNRVVSYADVVPPSVPANLIEVSKTSTTISISWDASTDDVSVTGYNVYVNGVYNSFTTTTNKTITGLTLSTTYLLSVSAIDSSANESAQTTALSITTNASDLYETEYQAILDYATTNGFDLPDSTQKTKDNNKVKYLKAVGAWSALDTVRIFNSTYSPTSWAKNMYRLNFKNPSLYPLTAVAGLEPSFTSGSGFNIVGGSGKYAKTGFIPSSHAVNFGGSNCSEIMGLFNIPSTFSTNVWITGGRSNAGDANQILVGSTVNGSLIFRLGSTGTVFTVAQTDLNAHFHCYKSAGALKLFRNGLTEMTASSSAGIGTTVSTTEQYILGVNDNGTLLSSAMNVGMKYQLIGSALDTKKNEIYQIMNETYEP